MAKTNMEDLSSHKGKKLKSYNIQYKLDAIKFAEENSNHSASRKSGVVVKRIREWRGNKDQLEELRQCSYGAKRFRLDGAGEKPLAPEMEDVLLEWIHSRQLKGLPVSRKLIMRKDQHLSKEQQNMEDFTASNGWIQKFMRRHGLSLRRKTTVAQKDPEQLVDKLVAYMYVLQARILSKHFGYQPCNIIAMDETAVWADMTSETTVESNPIQAGPFWNHIGWGGGIVPPPPCFSSICCPITTKLGMLVLWHKISQNQ